jgi:hypothetical protein
LVTICTVPGQSASATDLLLAWGQGEPDSRDRLTPLVYDELRRAGWSISAERARGSRATGHRTRQRSYLRLVEVDRIQLEAVVISRAGRPRHAAFAGGRGSRPCNDKRGGGTRKISLDEASAALVDSGLDLDALDEALRKPESVHPRKVRVVELRFFVGLNLEEAAEMLQVSPDTVKRDWRFAKLWPLRKLSDVNER